MDGSNTKTSDEEDDQEDRPNEPIGDHAASRRSPTSPKTTEPARNREIAHHFSSVPHQQLLHASMTGNPLDIANMALSQRPQQASMSLFLPPHQATRPQTQQQQIQMLLLSQLHARPRSSDYAQAFNHVIRQQQGLQNYENLHRILLLQHQRQAEQQRRSSSSALSAQISLLGPQQDMHSQSSLPAGTSFSSQLPLSSIDTHITSPQIEQMRLGNRNMMLQTTTPQQETTPLFGGSALSALLSREQGRLQSLAGGLSTEQMTVANGTGGGGAAAMAVGAPQDLSSSSSRLLDLSAQLRRQQQIPLLPQEDIETEQDVFVLQNERFPQTLYRMLEDAEKFGNESVIGFTTSGRAFEIRNPIVFEREIIPKYFSHGRASSFKRQLNLYGFKIMSQGADAGAYAHPEFSKDDKQKSQSIKRLK